MKEFRVYFLDMDNITESLENASSTSIDNWKEFEKINGKLSKEAEEFITHCEYLGNVVTLDKFQSYFNGNEISTDNFYIYITNNY